MLQDRCSAQHKKMGGLLEETKPVLPWSFITCFCKSGEKFIPLRTSLLGVPASLLSAKHEI